MKITKLDAARRQLSTAIDLWQTGGDPVSGHTLAYAAYQVIHDLNRRDKGPPLLLDSAIARPEQRAAFVNEVKFFADYFKHADDRRKGKRQDPLSVDFNPVVNETFLAFAVMGLTFLRIDLTAKEAAYKAWFSIEYPAMWSPEGRQLMTESFPAGSLESVRGVDKGPFFDLLKQSAWDSGTFAQRDVVA